jgi:hypothetical protein
MWSGRRGQTWQFQHLVFERSSNIFERDASHIIAPVLGKVCAFGLGTLDIAIERAGFRILCFRERLSHRWDSVFFRSAGHEGPDSTFLEKTRHLAHVGEWMKEQGEGGIYILRPGWM